MNNTVYTNAITLLAWIGLSLTAAAQQSETVSKTVRKEFAVSTADVLRIAAEKATIGITGWQQDRIQITITFSATHADRKVATRELDYMQYSLARDKHAIELRNAFMLPAATDNIKSRLAVNFELMVPLNMQVQLSNRYGHASLRGLAGKINASLEFSDLDLDGIGGEVTLNVSYGEVRGRDISVTTFRCHDEKSQITIDIGKGAYNFTSKHSTLDLTLNDVLSLTTEGSRTDVTVRPGRTDAYDYKLINKEGKIYLPPAYTDRLKKEGNQSSLLIRSAPVKPMIQITTTFNTITLK